MCEKGQEGLGRMATRPTAGDLAQTGIEALAVERLRMGPEGAAELDPWRDFDFCRSGGQCSELIADRMVGMIFGQRRDAVETGNVEPAPKQAGEPGDGTLARPERKSGGEGKGGGGRG